MDFRCIGGGAYAIISQIDGAVLGEVHESIREGWRRVVVVNGEEVFHSRSRESMIYDLRTYFRDDPRAQQPEQVRRIVVLMGLAESDPEGQSRIAAFRKTLQGLGWTEGRNVRTDYYWAAGDVDRTHALAKCSRSQRTYIRQPTSIMSSMFWHANLMAACGP